MSKTSNHLIKTSISEEDFEHYEKLIGFDAACALLVGRAKSAKKLEVKRAKCLSTSESKDRRMGLAMARPDGRLNGYNIASSSLVGRMGGKRKAKKSKKGY
jgi:hypothetical protein